MIFLKILGSLALLMFGMKLMSEALQKMLAPQLRHVLGTMTTNRFTGVMAGMFVTAAVQSSTATTLMTVSFVNAGLVTLMQAISVIMGAHIGTTVTAWLMALGFSVDLSAVVFPAFFLGIILIYMKSRRTFGDFLFGVAFLFFGLDTLNDAGFAVLADPATGAGIRAFFESLSDASFWNALFFLMMGTILTMCAQSSAAITALTMLLCATGLLPVELGVMLVLGENVGTTITANIAAAKATLQARRAAFAHFTVNLIGVAWALILFKPFFQLVCQLCGFDPVMAPASPHFAVRSTVVLAAYHTVFNLFNTLLLIGFVRYIERVVCWVIQPKTADTEEEFKLHFIQLGLMKTPELSVLEAQKEIRQFSERMQQMFGMVRELLTEKDEEKFGKLYERIENYERISDNMEIEIAKYLDQVGDAHLSDDTKGKIRAMLREISELESIGDSCYKMARTIHRKVLGKQEHFTERQYEHIHQMLELTDQSLTQMNVLMGGRKDAYDVNRTFNIEHEINNYRNQLKSQNINDINNHLYNYAAGTIYMDIINECEKLGDYVVNVVEARTGRGKS